MNTCIQNYVFRLSSHYPMQNAVEYGLKVRVKIDLVNLTLEILFEDKSMKFFGNGDCNKRKYRKLRFAYY